MFTVAAMLATFGVVVKLMSNNDGANFVYFVMILADVLFGGRRAR